MNTDDDLCYFLSSELQSAARIVKRGRKYRLSQIFPHFDFSLPQQDRDPNGLKKFFDNESDNLTQLFNELSSRSYTPRPYTGVAIERKGKDPRTLLVPHPRDRVVFTWVLRKIKPKFTDLGKYNILGSGLNNELRRPKAIFNALLLALPTARYVLKVDIKDFFPSIKRDLLLAKLMGILGDSYPYNVIVRSLDNSITVADPRYVSIFPSEDTVIGIPQGCAFSPLLANFYFSEVDKWLKQNGYIAYRYLDDLLILIPEKQKAVRVFDRVNKMATSLGLQVHELRENSKKSYLVSANQKFEFLGIEIDNNEVHIPYKEFQRAVDHIRTDLFNTVTIEKFGYDNVVVATSSYLKGWKAYYEKICPTDYGLFRVAKNKELKKYYKGIVSDTVGVTSCRQLYF